MMKGYFALTLALTLGSTAVAAEFPVGKYDCSIDETRVSRVEFSDVGLGSPFMKVDIKNERFDLSLRGLGIVTIYKDHKTGKETRNLRVAGSTYQIYFDSANRVGLQEDKLNCTKL